jgi:hypothetical protein
MAILLRYFDFLAPRDVYVLWFSNLLTVGVPDEGYTTIQSVDCGCT